MDRIKTELTQVRLRKMFQKNKDYLQNIFDGKIKSVRHEAFYKSVRTRQAHFYTIISYPFTDEELDKVILRLNKGRSAGMDDYPPELFIYAGKGVRQSLLQLLNQIKETREIPDQWNLLKIVTI